MKKSVAKLLWCIFILGILFSFFGCGGEKEEDPLIAFSDKTEIQDISTDQKNGPTLGAQEESLSPAVGETIKVNDNSDVFENISSEDIFSDDITAITIGDILSCRLEGDYGLKRAIIGNLYVELHYTTWDEALYISDMYLPLEKDIFSVYKKAVREGGEFPKDEFYQRYIQSPKGIMINDFPFIDSFFSKDMQRGYARLIHRLFTSTEKHRIFIDISVSNVQRGQILAECGDRIRLINDFDVTFSDPKGFVEDLIAGTIESPSATEWYEESIRLIQTISVSKDPNFIPTFTPTMQTKLQHKEEYVISPKEVKTIRVGKDLLFDVSGNYGITHWSVKSKSYPQVRIEYSPWGPRDMPLYMYELGITDDEDFEKYASRIKNKKEGLLLNGYTWSDEIFTSSDFKRIERVLVTTTPRHKILVSFIGEGDIDDATARAGFEKISPDYFGGYNKNEAVFNSSRLKKEIEKGGDELKGLKKCIEESDAFVRSLTIEYEE